MARGPQSEIHDPLLGAEEGQAEAHPSPTQSEPEPDDDRVLTSPESNVGCFPGGEVAPGSMKLELLEAFDSRQLAGRGTASQLQTVFNTINLYVGVGLVTIGYAVALGGWASLVSCAPPSVLVCFDRPGLSDAELSFLEEQTSCMII